MNGHEPFMKGLQMMWHTTKSQYETTLQPIDLYCMTGERLSVVEVQCERLRMLYRDCARPPPPPLQTERRQVLTLTYGRLLCYVSSLNFLYVFYSLKRSLGVHPVSSLQ